MVGPPSVPKGISDPRAYEFCYQPTLWPEIEGFQESWRAYYAEMERLAERLMAAFAEALGLESTFFKPYLSHPIFRTAGIILSRNYCCCRSRSATRWRPYRLWIFDNTTSTTRFHWTSDI